MQGGDKVDERFMEVDGKLSEVLGDYYGKGGIFENETTVIDLKCRRVESGNNVEVDEVDTLNGPILIDE